MSFGEQTVFLPDKHQMIHFFTEVKVEAQQMFSDGQHSTSAVQVV